MTVDRVFSREASIVEIIHKARRAFRRGIYFVKTGYLNTGERVNPDFDSDNFNNHFKVYQFLLQFVAGKDVLDVGCGTGYGSDYLASKAKSVIGIDISSNAIRFAGKRYRRPRFFIMDAHRLNIPDKSVDVVVSSENFEHLSDHNQHLLEIARVLRPDGMCFIATPNKKVFSGGKYHTREFTKNELESLLKNHFAEVQIVDSLLQNTTDKPPVSPGPLSVFGRTVDTTYQSNTFSLFSFSCRPLDYANRPSLP